MKGLIIALLVLFISSSIFAQPYLDPNLTVDQRVNDLLNRMTLDEKIGQMTQPDRVALSNISDIKTYLLGSLLSGGGSAPDNNSPVGWADMYDQYQNQALQTRLKIPLIYGIDAVHGHNNLKGAVIFPHNIGLGATRNPELIKKAAEITAAEVAATGIDWTFAPCIAVVRDERWGRTYEGFGETTELAQMGGAASVEGLQGDTLSASRSIVGCAKHYLGDGGTDGGVDQGNTIIDEATLRAIHLPGYISAIEKGVGTVMASFSSWNGAKMHGNKYLLTDVLKGELGFKGFVISDWAGIDQLPGDYTSDVEQSINAGVDMIMVPYDYTGFISTLRGLVNQGKITQERIDDAVRRILKIKFELGLFEKPLTDRTLIADVGSEAHREIARQCVRESIVLIQKKDGILPLPKTNVRILVAGSNANDLGNQCGGWTISWQGGSGNVTEGTTILEALQKAAPNADIEFSKDGSFSNTEADYLIVVVGETPYAEGSGDKSDLILERRDISLIKKMKALGKPVILILVTGRPMIIEPVLHFTDAIFAAWLPGTEGDGVTDVLFGDFQPKGLLPHTWPKIMSQIPINFGDADYKPLYEYGHGITSFEDSPAGSTPRLLSGIVSVDGKTIELTFNKKMQTTGNPVFEVRVNSLPVSVTMELSLKEGDDNTVNINADFGILPGDMVSLQLVSGQLESTDAGVVSSLGVVDLFNEVKAPAFQVPGKIEAEDYSDMFGIETEGTSDIGGGLNVGWIDDGDWLEYFISAPAAGGYLMQLRVASLNGGGRINFKSDDTNLGSRSVSATGGWQTWTTLIQPVGLKQGEQTFRITAEKGGFNLNWLNFSPIVSVDDQAIIPSKTELRQNYPNPFNPVSKIRYEIAKMGHVNLSVYNLLGQEVAVLVNQEQAPGYYNVEIDGSNLSSGVYLYRLTVDGYSSAKKFMLVK